jgi:hypothetical protein
VTHFLRATTANHHISKFLFKNKILFADYASRVNRG